MAVQEQWVRLAPAFVPPDLDDGVPAHERLRFTDVSGCVTAFHEGTGLAQDGVDVEYGLNRSVFFQIPSLSYGMFRKDRRFSSAHLGRLRC